MYCAIYGISNFVICAFELTADPHPEPDESSLYPNILLFIA
jgi:hypothetical protein